MVVISPKLITNFPALILRLSLERQIPLTSHRKALVEQGALFSYGPDFVAVGQDIARYVDRILKGTKPADLPVEQPMTFEFVVNLKTARELGITFPNEILLQVTEVIQ